MGCSSNLSCIYHLMFTYLAICDPFVCILNVRELFKWNEELYFCFNLISNRLYLNIFPILVSTSHSNGKFAYVTIYIYIWYIQSFTEASLTENYIINFHISINNCFVHPYWILSYFLSQIKSFMTKFCVHKC